jgi:hypothetical protein
MGERLVIRLSRKLKQIECSRTAIFRAFRFPTFQKFGATNQPASFSGFAFLNFARELSAEWG